MPTRLATIIALLAFAACLFIGGFGAGNPFTTTVGRALVAMAATYGIGLVVGIMGQRTIDENLAAAAAVVPTSTAAADAAAKPPQPPPSPKAGRRR